MCSQSPALFTSIMPAIVRPRKTSRDSSLPPTFEAAESVVLGAEEVVVTMVFEASLGLTFIAGRILQQRKLRVDVPRGTLFGSELKVTTHRRVFHVEQLVSFPLVPQAPKLFKVE